jgi:Ca2+-binding RTX toxin-like protein
MAVVNGTNASETIDQLDGVTNSSDRISGLGGNDTIHGLGGNDSIHGGSGNDVVYAGSGNDSIYGDAGTDFLYGEAGDDTFVMADVAALDHVEGGTGTDWLDLGAVVFPGDVDPMEKHLGMRVDLAEGKYRYINDNGPNQIFDVFDVECVKGSGLFDNLAGNDLNNILDGQGGGDNLQGFGGNDLLRGGDGGDYVYGGEGIDRIEGGAGEDSLRGEAGADLIFGGDGDDNIWGGDGADALDGGAGRDLAFYNYVAAVTGAVASLADPSINSGDAAGDTYVSIEGLLGTIHDDRLYGDAGTNDLYGDKGDDRLDGGSGDDFLRGDAGADALVGGAGIDIAIVTGGSDIDPGDALVASLANPAVNTYEAAGDTYSSVEGLHGDFLFYYRLYGNSGANFLFGGMLDDTLSGGAGDDFLAGGEGRDRLFGGGDTDTASYAEAASAVTVDLSDFSGNAGDAEGDSYNSIEIIEGSAFHDSLSGDAAANVLVGLAGNDGLAGAAGNDTLRGGQGGDILSGGDGVDTASYSGASAGVIASLANAPINSGEAAGDEYASVENLTGSTFNDALNGDNAVNAIDGGNRNDTIKGYGGNDMLTGGQGADIFVFNAALDSLGNVDTLADFSAIDDTIQLDDKFFAALGLGPLAASAFKSLDLGPADADDRVLYNPVTGNLAYDADGSGVAFSAIKFANIATHAALTNADFVVI